MNKPASTYGAYASRQQPDFDQKDIVTKVASISLPFELQGRLLEIEIEEATRKFVRAMELRGWTLYKHPQMPQNPQWVTDGKGRMAPYLAIDWEGKYPSTKRAQAVGAMHGPQDAQHKGPVPTTREESLEDTDGEVEYRCVGVFIAPQAVLETLLPIKSQEEAAKHRSVFGPT